MSLLFSRRRGRSSGLTQQGDKGRAGRTRRALSLEVMESRTLMTGTLTPLINSPPNGSDTMMLETNGDVIMEAGGVSNQYFVLHPDSRGNYVDGTWTQVASTTLNRLYPGSAILPDGRMLVIGGEYSGPGGPNNDTNEGEIYTPSTNTWKTIATFPQANFGDEEVVNLGGGKVLAPYLIGPQTYIYNANTDTWTQTGTKLRNDRSDEEGYVRLPDGSILSYDIEGSINANQGHAQRYIPSTGTWVDAGNVPVLLSTEAVGEELGAGMLLPDGRVFWLGGNGNTAYYTPSTNTWVAGPVIPNGLGADDAPASELPNGKILFSADTPLFTQPAHWFEYDPVAQTYTDISSEFPSDYTSGPSYVGRQLSLPNGQVLIDDGGNDLYLYTPDSAALPSNVPTISSIVPNPAGVGYLLTGTGINGNNEGSVYGDDAQMATNYPIVSFTSTTGQVSYGTTSNFDYTEEQGSKPLTTNFVPPTGLTTGTYSVRVIANGVASSPTSLSISGPTIAIPASATPNPVYTTSTQLSVLGADAGGESNLTYTWTTTSSPAGVAAPTFAINDTNASKNDKVTFHGIGAYTFQVLVTNATGVSAISTVSVNVNPSLSSFGLTPSKSQLAVNQTLQFVASGLDQFGNTITTSTSFVWSVASGGGTVTSSGLYTAPTTGTIATVKVSTGTLNLTSTVYVLSNPWISTDVGSPTLGGNAADNGSGQFTVLGAGTGTSATSDQLQYAYLSVVGNSTVVAQVSSLQNTNGAAKAGIMFRNDTTAGSLEVMVVHHPLQRAGVLLSHPGQRQHHQPHDGEGDGRLLSQARPSRQPVQRLLLLEWSDLDAGQCRDRRDEHDGRCRGGRHQRQRVVDQHGGLQPRARGFESHRQHCGLGQSQSCDDQFDHPLGPGCGLRGRTSPDLHLGDDLVASGLGLPDLRDECQQRLQERRGHLLQGRDLFVQSHPGQRPRIFGDQLGHRHGRPDVHELAADAFGRDRAGGTDPALQRRPLRPVRQHAREPAEVHLLDHRGRGRW